MPYIACNFSIRVSPFSFGELNKFTIFKKIPTNISFVNISEIFYDFHFSFFTFHFSLFTIIVMFHKASYIIPLVEEDKNESSLQQPFPYVTQGFYQHLV